jgi:uncharacterized repeat protein (TIGR03803 family)
MPHFEFRNVLSASILLTFAVAVIPATAQTFTVLHTFTGGADGAYPYAGVTIDAAGNLYGTTGYGGNTGGNCSPSGCGTAYKLTHKNGGWTLTPLHQFVGGSDGVLPSGGIVIGPNGTLYGTTNAGGEFASGTAFNLSPPATAPKTALTPWPETLLCSFSGTDGGSPTYGDLVFDREGNLYGTGGGADGNGGVFELTKSNGSWISTEIYSFNGDDGATPLGGVIFDGNGNLYGTTASGGFMGNGVVYELMPSASGWVEQVLYAFQNGGDGYNPQGSLVFDQFGNLYGTTTYGGQDGGGTVYELSPSNGGWVLNTLHSFSGAYGPASGLAMDTAGNLYGTNFGEGAFGDGNVFKLTLDDGGWVYTSLHDFTNGSDGAGPVGPPTVAADGTVYGTTLSGGSYCSGGCGLVWKITP